MKDQGRADSTVRAYGADLRGYFEFAGVHTTDEFAQKAAQYLTRVRNDKAAKTVRRYMGTLNVFGEWAGLTKPLANYRAPTPARPRPHPLPEGVAGVLAMIDAAETQDEVNLVVLCGLVGLRVGEATQAEIEDVDIQDAMLMVHGKGDKEREVPLTQRVLDYLMPRLLDHDATDRRLVRMHERWARKTVTRLAERASLTRAASSHDLRATFATAAYAGSGDLRAVQELLGHADSRTTQVYTGISDKAMRAAADITGGA